MGFGTQRVQAVRVIDEASEDSVDIDWDGTYNAMAVIDSRMKVEVEDGSVAKDQVLTYGFTLNYAYDETVNTWGRMILETDDDAIPDGQTAQLVIPLMQYYDDKTHTWMRWRGESGSLWTTVIGLYTPTFDSVMDDTLDTVKVSNDTAVNLKVDGSDVIQPVSGTVAVSNDVALESSQGQWRGAVSGLSDWKEADGKPRISQQPYLYDIAEENIAGHKAFYKIGFNPEITNTEETVWPYGGKYAFMKGEDQLEIASSDNTQDIGSILFNSTSTGGSTTTLIDTGVDFTAGGTPVAIFDCVILDKAGTTPEWGYVTGVTANTLTIAGGFSAGGSADTRDYIILNKTAYTGAQAVYIGYLDSDFVSHNEIVILNGTTAVPTVNTDYYRINDIIIIAAGTLESSLGTIQLRDITDTPVYSQISTGFTRARSAVFTVPYGKVLYITSWNSAWASPNDSKVQSLRMILRANRAPQNNFYTGSLFYPIAEVMLSNQATTSEFDCPLNFPAGTDIIVSGVSTNAAGTGPATTVLRGWSENG